jgi:hypothetical protein
MPLSFPPVRRWAIPVLAWLLALGCASAMAATPGSSSRPVLRCGWLDNPTPGNVWLTDRQGQWLIGEQGGYQARGDWPDFPARRWVRTNGWYGYGCACLSVLDDAAGHRILRILGGRSRPLAACLGDSRLPRRDPKADRQGS